MSQCIVKRHLCHDIKKPMSYHIMELYVTTCHMSQLSWHPYLKPAKSYKKTVNPLHSNTTRYQYDSLTNVKNSL